MKYVRSKYYIKSLEPYDGKPSRTVLMGGKLREEPTYPTHRSLLNLINEV